MFVQKNISISFKQEGKRKHFLNNGNALRNQFVGWIAVYVSVESTRIIDNLPVQIVTD